MTGGKLRMTESMLGMTDGEHLCSVGFETLESAEIYGIVGKDNVSGVKEDAGAHVYALLGRRGYLNLRNGYTVTPRNDFPKLGNALRGSVLERLGTILFKHRCCQRWYLVCRESNSRRISPCKGAYRRKVHLSENLPHRAPQKRGHIGRKILAIIHYALVIWAPRALRRPSMSW